MIYRNIYTAQLADGITKETLTKALEKCHKDDAVISLSVMNWKNRIFLYYETRDRNDITPAALWDGLDGLLAEFPGEETPRIWVPMFDIFHYNAPVDDDEWTRHTPSQPYAQMMRIYPDKLGSYIFYHQQMQEETPGRGPKYGIICMSENLLFFYLERPDCTDGLTFKGRLDTHNSPTDWETVMRPHFMPWDDYDPPVAWRTDVDLLYHFETVVEQ